MGQVQIEEQCRECGGTGLYAGMAERDGAAVVCFRCKGTGCFTHSYTPFTRRQPRPDKVTRVFQCNPGIGIGTGKGQYKLSDFGGMPIKAWQQGKPFPPKSENRRFTCPAWWYQSADYEKKPDCNTQMLGNAFSGCERFAQKDECWAEWDKANPA